MSDWTSQHYLLKPRLFVASGLGSHTSKIKAYDIHYKTHLSLIFRLIKSNQSMNKLATVYFMHLLKIFYCLSIDWIELNQWITWTNERKTIINGKNTLIIKLIRSVLCVYYITYLDDVISVKSHSCTNKSTCKCLRLWNMSHKRSLSKL